MTSVQAGNTIAPRAGLAGLTYRQLLAIIALINALVATYLHLWKLGLAGNLACGGGGGCAIVQFSRWSWFFGVDVALIGAIGYTLILIVAVAGSTESRADSRGPAIILATMIFGAFLFTIRLKWAEWFMLHTFCPWCAISAFSITLSTVIISLELRRIRILASSPPA
jgi:uncharacterized membrane protein